MRSKQLIGTFGLMAFPTTREGQISPAVLAVD